MKRARRRSAGSFGQQSDVSYSDTDEYQPRSGSVVPGERCSSGDRHKAELRRLKNREAARRVRERKSNQLNTYKSQVDELKRENQKLLQIIAQLQSASIGCISGAPLATTTSTLGPDAEADGPVGTASCLSAGVPPDSIDSGGPSGIRSADAGALGSASHLLPTDQLASPPAAAAAPGSGSRQQQQRQQLPPQRLLASTTSCPPGAPGGTVSAANGVAAAAGGAGGAPDANASGSCVLSQPVNTSAVFSSSTQQLLSGCHSAPLAFLQPTNSMQQAVRNQVPLQRSCGCTGDEECEECEGVRVTLSSASNLPLVTTPGPRPKLLTLEDLNLAGLSRAASLHTGSLMSAPLLPTRVSGSSLARDDATAAAAGRSADGAAFHHHHHHNHHQQRLGQITEKQADDADVGMAVDFVGTLEPSRGVGGHAARLDSHSSSGHAVFGSGGEARLAEGGSITESCYVRKSSSRSTRQRSMPPEAPTQQQQAAAAASTAAAATAAGASGSGFASGSALQQQQQQQQWEAAAMAGSMGTPPGNAAASPSDAAAAADVVMNAAPQIIPVMGMDSAAAAAPVGAVGSNSSMMHPGSYVKSELQSSAAAAAAAPGVDASGSGSMLAPTAAMQPPAAVATADYGTAAAPQQQHGHAHKSSKPGQKLMRSIAAAVNGLVRSGRRNSGSSCGTPRSATAAAAAALRQQEEQLAGRSLSATMLGPGTQQFTPMLGAASFTTGVNGAAGATAAMQQQQQMLLSSSGMLASGYSSTGMLSIQQQQQLLLGQMQMTQGFSSGEFSSGGLNLGQQQQQQQQSEDDAIILAAQLMLHQQHQQRASTGGRAGGAQQKQGRGSAPGSIPAPQQQQQQQQQGGVAPGSNSRRPSAMDTTPIWPGQDSPCLPAQQQQQQQQQVFGLEQLPKRLAAAVLPLDFQATYTDGGLLDDAVNEGLLNDDVVMQLARQEGVLIDDPGSAFFF